MALGAAIIADSVDQPSAIDNIYNATDNGKNEKHGDDQALSKKQKQIDDLEKQLENATGSERAKIKAKIENIRRIAQKNRKGEEHSRGCKR
ncbi:hypothetical protein [Methylomonas sp. AM2-LC]|uniref:hypothetical protein n=1 Tax=Methylomonas sp. AM2-LC TaxID=3153301 RepID=UPI003267DC4F